MSGVRNCLTCLFEPEWESSMRAYTRGKCRKKKPKGIPANFVEGLMHEYGDEVFVTSGGRRWKVTNCPAHQSKDQANTPAREAGGE